MPKAVSADFEAAWGRVAARYVAWSVEVYRRYWNGSAYVLEATPITLEPQHLQAVAPIIMNLEEANGGEILTSTSGVYIRNSAFAQRWLTTNVIDSVWAPTASRPFGYKAQGSQFKIKYGYRLASGDFETVALFTGYAEKPKYDSDKGSVEIRLTGGEVLLQGKSAQNVSNTLTDQAATGTVDGTNDTFEMDYSVWEVAAVKVAGVTKTQGVHYDLQDMGLPGTKAKIVFRSGHIPGITSPATTITWTGRQWKRNQQFSALVGLLCDLAGIGSGARTIEEPEWPAAAVEFHVDTQAEMETMTLVDVDTKSEAGALKGFILDDFDDGDLSAPAWYLAAGSGYAASGGKMVASSPSGYAALLYSSTGRGIGVGAIQNGSFQYWAKLISGQLTIWPWRRNLFPGGAQGMGVRITSTAVQIVEEVSGSINVLATAAFTPGASGDLLQMAYSGTNSLEVRVGATTINGTFSSGVLLPFSSLEFRVEATGSAEVDDIAYTVEDDLDDAFSVTHATAETAEEDLTAAPSSWGAFEADVDGEDGSVEFTLRVADAPGGPYTDTTLTPGAVPASPLKRYAKLRVRWLMDAGGRTAPKVTRAQVNAYLTTLTLTQADFSGMDAWEAVKFLAKGPGMDLFFDGDGHLYYVNKRDVTTPDFVLDENNAILRVDHVDTGEDDVFTEVQMRYGDYYAEWNSTKEGEAAPTPTDDHGSRILNLDFSRYFFSADVDITQSIARMRYQQKSPQKRKVTATARLIPHMNPRDALSVSFRQTPLRKDVIFGDEMQHNPPMGGDEKGPSNVLLQRMPGKAVGLIYDVMNKTQKMTVLEVLS